MKKQKVINKQKSKKGGPSSIILIVLVFTGLILIVLPNYVKWGDVKEIIHPDNYSYTTGTILKVDAVKLPQSTRLGSGTTTIYIINYSYFVSGKEYTGKSEMNLYPSNTKSVVVKYNKMKPLESYLVIK